MTSEIPLQDLVQDMFSNPEYTKKIQAMLHSEEWSECLYTYSQDTSSYMGQIYSPNDLQKIRNSFQDIALNKQEPYFPHLERLGEIHNQMLKRHIGHKKSK